MTSACPPPPTPVTPDRAARAARASRIEGLIAGRPQTGPQTVHFDIANACNTRCTTCWHHSPHLTAEHTPTAAWKRRTLPLATFRALMDQLDALGGLEQIVLSGMGDPTLHPDLPAMVELAHARGVGVTIITNLLRADLPRLLASPGELHLLASVCGVTEPVWQAFHAHPRPDGFETLLAQLARCRDHGFRPKHVQVINRQNFHQLVAMVDFAARYPAERVNFKLASLARGTEAVALSDAERRHLQDTLIPEAQDRARALGVETDLAAFATQIHPGSHRTAPIEATGCFMGYLYARVTVDLELLYCCNTQVSVGHLGPDVDLGALWSGPRYQAMRDQLRAGRYFAGCDQCGKYKQNLKWSERLRATLPPAVFADLIGRPEAAP